MRLRLDGIILWKGQFVHCQFKKDLPHASFNGLTLSWSLGSGVFIEDYQARDWPKIRHYILQLISLRNADTRLEYLR